mgnify:CR=1 FL=1
MFTVIFLSRAAQASLERWRDLFTPFEEQGDLAFCTWNAGSSPRSLREAVPDLPAVIKGKREWRAIIVGTGDDTAASRRTGIDFNPFDLSARDGQWQQASGDSAGHSPHAVVRLTHMLLGVPELGPKAFIPDPSYEDPQSRTRIHLSDFRAAHPELTDEESLAQFNINFLLGNNRQTRYRVVHPSRDEEATHAEVSRAYDLDQVPPIEVLLVATRVTSRSTPSDLLELAWSSSDERVMSRFVERNNFPASSRFLVFDLKPPGHTEFDLNELLFAVSVLTLAINDLPPSGLQAERLYEIELDIDKGSLAALLNDHLGQLVRVREYIQTRLKDQRPRSGVALREVLPRINLTVDFERLKGEGLSVATTGYSLAADRPGDDNHRWQESVGTVSADAKRFMREPVRALQQTVAEARIREASLTSEEVPLTDIDIAELEVELAARSDGLVRKASGVSVTTAQLDQIIKEHNATISGAIHERMRSRSIAMASAVVLGAWAIALVPYLIAALFDGGVNLAESFLLTLIVIGVVATAGLITLEVMRRRLIALLKNFNRDLRDFVTKVGHGASEYSEFLSDLVTYASGRRRLLAEQHRVKQRSSEKVQLHRLLRRIEERIETEKSLVRSLDQPLQIEQGGHIVADVEQYGASRAARVLLWPAGRTLCEFNHSGDNVKAPYSFVTRLAVADLALNEPVEAWFADPDAAPHTPATPEVPTLSSEHVEGPPDA